MEESISALVAGALKMESASNLRKSVVTVLSAAVIDPKVFIDILTQRGKERSDTEREYDGDVSNLSDDDAPAKSNTSAPAEETGSIKSSKLISTILELCVKLLKSKHCHAEATAEFAIYKVRKLGC